jgi:hypothetical protein
MTAILARSARAALLAAALLGSSARAAPAEAPHDPGLAAFRAWLARERPGYGADEGR